MQTATFDSLWNSYDTTQMAVSAPVSPNAVNDLAHDSHVDVYYTSYNIPGGVAALASCEASIATVCDHWHVLYDSVKMTQAPFNTASTRKHIACHETGHTVGLLHAAFGALTDPYPEWTTADYGCMVESAPFDSLLRSHNVDHINNYY